MLTYPNIDPIALQIGPIAVHWYGIMYLLGFSLAWLLLRFRADKTGFMTHEQVSDLIFYAAMGVIIGGRVGYMLFYSFPVLIHFPLQIFMIWEGGMSFHGGLLGVFIAMYWYAKKLKVAVFDITDFIAPVVPLGLAAGRLGNFINGELWGRVTTVPWGMLFPGAGDQLRHPSELYELFLEGILLFVLLWWYSNRPRPRFAVTGLFLTGYGVFRIFCECFREPDSQYGYFVGGWLTMGQILSIPMILLGMFFFIYSYKRSVL